MFCTKCGVELPDDVAFCTSCGERTGVDSGARSGGDDEPTRWISAQGGVSTQDGASAGGNASAGGGAVWGQPVPGAPLTAGGISQSQGQYAAKPVLASSVSAARPASAPTAPVASGAVLTAAAQAKPRNNIKMAAIGIACALAIVIAVLVGTRVLDLWGGDEATYVAYGSTEAAEVSQTTSIVPASAKDSPLGHYYVRILDATDDDGDVIDTLSMPRLEVQSSEGFRLSDFLDDASQTLAAGTYRLAITDDSGEDRKLPPLHVGTAGAGNASGSAGSSSNSGSSQSSEKPIMVIPDSGSSASTAQTPQGRNAAFLEVLNEVAEKYGETGIVAGAVTGDSSYWMAFGQGLCFAQLVDFGDGDKRLVVAYCTVELSDDDISASVLYGIDYPYTAEVYKYNSDTDTAERELAIEVPSTKGKYFIRFVEGSDGMKFIDCAEGTGKITTYYGLDDNGCFAKLAKFVLTYEDGETVYKINDSACSSGEWESERDKYDQDGATTVSYALCYEGSSEADARGASATDLGSLYMYGPEGSASAAADLLARLTYATTNSSEAPTKIIGDASGASDAIGTSDATSTSDAASNAASASAVGDVSARQRAYQLYNQKVLEEQGLYGAAAQAGNAEATEFIDGLCVVRLIDFDSSGIEELLLVHKSAGSEDDSDNLAFEVEVWGYDEAADAIATLCTSEIVFPGWQIGIYGIGSTPRLCISNGYDPVGQTDAKSETYFGLVDGELISKVYTTGSKAGKYLIDGVESTRDVMSQSISRFGTFNAVDDGTCVIYKLGVRQDGALQSPYLTVVDAVAATEETVAQISMGATLGEFSDDVIGMP